jgi:hypothetical protein
MKTNLRSLLLCVAVLASVMSVRAQVVLHSFSNFISPQTLFYGDWSATGDPFVGSTAPIPTFTQQIGSFNFAAGSNADTSYVEHFFASSLNLGSFDQLALTLRLLNDNTADSLTVFLLDTSARVASATFTTADFSAAGFSTRTLAFTPEIGFASGAVAGFRLSGNDPFASGVLSVAIDNLSATGRAPAAVPEPATYSLLGAGTLAILAISRRTRRAK